MSTPADDMNTRADDKPPGLFSSKPTALLAALAAGAGAIALASIGVEIWTDQWLAKTADLGVAFMSAPLGAATVILAALTARFNTAWAAPAFLMGVAYWLLFAFAG